MHFESPCDETTNLTTLIWTASLSLIRILL